MTWDKDMLAPIRGLTSGRVLAPLLVLTLLVCHGLFGGMHQSEPTLAPLGGHTSHAEVPAEQGMGASDEDLGSVGYAATLFFVMVAAFWLLLRTAAWRRAPAPPWFEERYRPAILLYPRGPTISTLQVFRL
jgi:hypothetical protein